MITVNAIGDACPIPVIKTKKALQELEGPGVLEVLVDNEIAVQNVTKLASSSGAGVSWEKTGEKEYRIAIKKEGGVLQQEQYEKQEQQKEAVCCTDSSGGTIVVVSSDRMGEGNDELGEVLMKGFIFAVSQLEELPGTILFYNGGARLTAEGSESLEDLKAMEAQGVQIMTCGTCLDYYGLKEKLQVGSVTNMYTIVETMNGAQKVIRP